MAKRKRTNPSRIPVSIDKIDRHELIASVIHGNMYYAWLLIIPVLIQQEGVPVKRVIELWDVVNDFVSAPDFVGERLNQELYGLEREISSHAPYPSIPFDSIRTLADLEAVRRKLKKNAIYSAICMILAGLHSTGEFDSKLLRRIYLNAELTLAEIEHGSTSYDELRAWAIKENILIAEDQDEMSMVTTEE